MIMSVDIGTSYSASCVLGPDGKAHPVEVSTGASMFGGQFSLPSAVFVEDNGDVLVGQAAMNSRKRKPENFRMEFKRNFGETYPILLGNRSFLPEELYTELLRHMKSCAEKVSGEAVEFAYLTHPAAYGKARIEKLCAATHAAGLFDVETVDEPTAAAMSYCAAGYIQNGQTLLVYDFGGGTFDVSLIRYENGAFSSLSESEGLEQCGGIDMDRLIYQDMLRAVDPQLLSRLQENPLYFMQFTGQLSELAVKAKHHLSAAKVFEDQIIVGFETIPYRLTVEQFDQMIAPLVGQTITTCHLALRNAGLSRDDLSAVLLVGGTSRVPLVQEMVRQFAGQIPVHCAPDLELAVAQGAINYRQFRAKPEEPTPEEIEAWYEQGLRMTVEDKWEEAVIWFGKAAEHGNTDAQNNLACCYDAGRGVEQSYEKAVEWYRRAAEQGHTDAQYNLGVCYESGTGVETNLMLAVVWYAKAAKQGNADAQFALGCCYEFGDGLPLDLKNAELWYGEAARQDHEQATAALERLHPAKPPQEKPKTSEKKPKTKAPTLNELAVAAVKAEFALHPEITKGAGAFSLSSLPKLRTQLNIPAPVDILLAHDDTMFKNGRNGFAVTSLGIYCRELWESRVYTSWQDFVRFDLEYNAENPKDIYLKKDALGNRVMISYFHIDSEPVLLKELLDFWIGLQRRLRSSARQELGMDV